MRPRIRLGLVGGKQACHHCHLRLLRKQTKWHPVAHTREQSLRTAVRLADFGGMNGRAGPAASKRDQPLSLFRQGLEKQVPLVDQCCPIPVREPHALGGGEASVRSGETGEHRQHDRQRERDAVAAADGAGGDDSGAGEPPAGDRRAGVIPGGEALSQRRALRENRDRPSRRNRSRTRAPRAGDRSPRMARR